MFAEPAAYSLSDTYHLPIAYIPLSVYKQKIPCRCRLIPLSALTHIEFDLYISYNEMKKDLM